MRLDAFAAHVLGKPAPSNWRSAANEIKYDNVSQELVKTYFAEANDEEETGGWDSGSEVPNVEVPTYDPAKKIGFQNWTPTVEVPHFNPQSLRLYADYRFQLIPLLVSVTDQPL